MRPELVGLVAIALAIAVALFISWNERRSPLAVSVEDAQRLVAAGDPSGWSAPAVEKPAGPVESVPERSEARVRRDHLRGRIVTAAAARAQPAAIDDPVAISAPSGELTDRIGGREDLMKSLNAEFMPLAEECITNALERDPGLSGMLAVGLEVIGDEELGAIIETVDFPDRNEIHEPQLMECISETVYSTTLPPPPESGRDALMLTLQVGMDGQPE